MGGAGTQRWWSHETNISSKDSLKVVITLFHTKLNPAVIERHNNSSSRRSNGGGSCRNDVIVGIIIIIIRIVVIGFK